MKKYRILIADDHSLIRQGIKSITRQDNSLEVIAEAANGFDLLNLLQHDPPDMVILDLIMPHLNGIESISRIRKTFPAITILVLTMHTSSQYLYQAIASGAHGYLIKDESDHELLKAIQTIRDGGIYISPQLPPEIKDEVLIAFRDQRKMPFVELSAREKQVLKLVVQGCSSKKIAKMLGLSPRTIDHHRANLIKKFKMKNTVDLVNYVVRNAVVMPDE